MKRKIDTDAKVAWLNLTSFQGFGGIHVYGQVVGQRDADLDQVEVDVTRPMTAEEAEHLNLLDGDGYNDSHYKEGDTLYRFRHESEIISLADAAMHQGFPNCQLLLVGWSGLAQPSETVWCIDPEAKTQLNNIWKTGEDLCRWDWGNKAHLAELEGLAAQWREIAQKYGWEN